MTTFTTARFEAYCTRFAPEFRAEALAVATVTADTVAIPSAALAALRTRFAPLPRRGLGDAVALVAEPIARLSDAVLGTKLVGCGGCAQRRAKLNALVPDLTRPLGPQP